MDEKPGSKLAGRQVVFSKLKFWNNLWNNLVIEPDPKLG
jgi:hypothetical protein